VEDSVDIASYLNGFLMGSLTTFLLLLLMAMANKRNGE
tara:strand:- start:320 stop:433 length:114 start_codon:yes stop_codon:yes gene_type:complete